MPTLSEPASQAHAHVDWKSTQDLRRFASDVLFDHSEHRGAPELLSKNTKSQSICDARDVSIIEDW
jgi:hypothetical protein